MKASIPGFNLLGAGSGGGEGHFPAWFSLFM